MAALRRMRKGLSVGPTELTLGIGALVIIVIVATSTGRSPLPSISDFLSQFNINSGQTSDPDYLIAKHSTDALACAIDAATLSTSTESPNCIQEVSNKAKDLETQLNSKQATIEAGSFAYSDITEVPIEILKHYNPFTDKIEEVKLGKYSACGSLISRSNFPPQSDPFVLNKIEVAAFMEEKDGVLCDCRITHEPSVSVSTDSVWGITEDEAKAICGLNFYREIRNIVWTTPIKFTGSYFEVISKNISVSQVRLSSRDSEFYRDYKDSSLFDSDITLRNEEIEKLGLGGEKPYTVSIITNKDGLFGEKNLIHITNNETGEYSRADIRTENLLLLISSNSLHPVNQEGLATNAPTKYESSSCQPAKNPSFIDYVKGECRVYKSYKQDYIVRNFQLPQKISKAEDWIPYYGDPQFLVYWQNFPLAEDTWTFDTDWKIYTLIVVAALIPPGKFFKFLNFLGKTGAPQIIQTATNKLAFRTAIKAYLYERALLRLAQAPGGRALQLKVLYTNVKGTLKRGITAATLSSTAAAAAYADSVLDKVDPKSNSLVLDIPHHDPESFKFSGQLEGRPVLLEQPNARRSFYIGPKLGTLYSTMHFASPCGSSAMTVEKRLISCDKYTFNRKDKTVGCQTPSLASEITKTCSVGSFLENVGIGYVEITTKTELVNTLRQAGFTVRTTIFDAEKGDWVFEGTPESAQRLEITKGGEKGNLYDNDDDGRIETFSLENCQIEGVLVHKVELSGDTKPNYCFRSTGTGKALLDWSGQAGGAVAIVAGTFFTAGVLGAALVIGGTITWVAADIHEAVMGNWPSRG